MAPNKGATLVEVIAAIAEAVGVMTTCRRVVPLLAVVDANVPRTSAVVEVAVAVDANAAVKFAVDGTMVADTLAAEDRAISVFSPA